jgi:hypothetical protein
MACLARMLIAILIYFTNLKDVISYNYIWNVVTHSLPSYPSISFTSPWTKTFASLKYIVSYVNKYTQLVHITNIILTTIVTESEGWFSYLITHWRGSSHHEIYLSVLLVFNLSWAWNFTLYRSWVTYLQILLIRRKLSSVLHRQWTSLCFFKHMYHVTCGCI